MQTWFRGAFVRRLLLGTILLLASGAPAMAQGDITVVESGGSLPGVPDEVPIAASLELNLPAGDYQWQTTTTESLTREDEPLEVHNGFLLSLDQNIVVQKAGAASTPLAAGTGMVVREGERLKPVATGDATGFIVIVELVAIADVGELETPGQTIPLRLEEGQYTIALLDITDLGDLDAGDIIEEAAGPAFSIANTDTPTEEVPLVVWLASIFLTGAFDASAATPADVAEDPALPTPTTETSEADASPEDAGAGDDSDGPVVRATTEPTTPANDSGSVQQIVLPEVPADVPVLSSATLDLPAGDYQWQSREMTTLTRTDDPLSVGDGFIVAVDAPVTVLRAGAASFTVQPGTGAVLTNGDRILPITSAETPAAIVIIELFAVAEADPATQPDQILPLTLDGGTFTIALLDLSAVPPDGPTPGEIIAGAAGPGFGIGTNPDQPEDITWLVAIFPA